MYTYICFAGFEPVIPVDGADKFSFSYSQKRTEKIFSPQQIVTQPIPLPQYNGKFHPPGKYYYLFDSLQCAG
jgi:hypothetical protein